MKKWDAILERRGAWLLVLLGLLFLLPGNNLLPLLDRDEPRFARAAVEMAERGDWVVPTFNADPNQSNADRVAAMRAGSTAMEVGFRFDKPPLTYWLMRASYAVFGINEFGARFHSVVTAIGVALVLFYTGRKWTGAAAGFLAGFGFLTCFQTAVHGRSAVADMPMVLCVTIAMIALWSVLKKFSWRGVLALYIALGVGFLAKGPVALAVPLLAMILWRFVFNRRPVAWRKLGLIPGLIVVALIAGAWGIPALLQTDGYFWRVGMGQHVVERGMSAFNGRFPFPLYYCFTVFLSLFPWCLFGGTFWRAARRGRDEFDSFLLAWFLAPFLIFSFYATQLPHYILPGLPAFLLILTRAWAKADETPRALRVFAIGAPLLLIGIVLVAAFVLRPLTPAVRAREFLANLPANAPRAFWRYKEPSVVFYNGGPWRGLDKPATAAEFLSQPGPRALIVEESERAVFRGDKAKDYLTELSDLPTNGVESLKIEGVNVARSMFVNVRVYFKR